MMQRLAPFDSRVARGSHSNSVSAVTRCGPPSRVIGETWTLA
jgi:hypothetical protein